MMTEIVPLSICEDMYNKTIYFRNNDDVQEDDLNLVIDHDKYFTISCAYTNFDLLRLKNLSKKSRYYNLAKIDDNSCYIGNLHDNKYKNCNATLFKLKVKSGCLNKNIHKYIIMILDNPDYNIDNNIIDTYGKYKLVLYSISKIGMYYEQLIYLTTLTSQ
jgi:hypothetical protein